MKKFLEEFIAFALKGNMIDLAVGMIIGSAFTSIVNSLVNDIFMPVLSIFTGKIDFSNMFIALNKQQKYVLDLYNQLGPSNKIRAESYLEGLADGSYRKKRNKKEKEKDSR